MKKIIFLFMFFFLSFIISCATTLKSIPNDYIIKQDAESITIGQISFPESEFFLVGSTITHAEGGDITVKNFNSGDEYIIVPDENNKKYYFYVPLPKGKYEISEVNWGGFKGKPRGFFILNENNKIIYIGTIELKKIEQSTGQKVTRWLLDNLSGSRSVPIKYSVIDNYDEVSQSFKEKYPNIKNEIEKSLINLQ